MSSGEKSQRNIPGHLDWHAKMHVKGALLRFMSSWFASDITTIFISHRATYVRHYSTIKSGPSKGIRTATSKIKVSSPGSESNSRTASSPSQTRKRLDHRAYLH